MKLAALANLALVLLVVPVSVSGCRRAETTEPTVTNASATLTSTAPSSSAAVVETVPAKCTSLTGTVGNGQITRTKRDAKDFVDVSLNGSPDVDVKEGPFSVEVETDANVQDHITAATSGTKLELGSKGSYCSNKLHIIVTMPLFHGAMIQGSGKIDITKASAASDVSLSISGSGNIKFRGAATALAAGVNGSGTVLLDTGTATTTNATINGSGAVRKTSFTPGAVTKLINGSGSVAL